MSDTKYAAPSGPPPASAGPSAGPSRAEVEAAEDPNQLPAYTQADVDALFHPSSTQVPPTYTGLPQVVALPQINTAFDSPFVRAYSPALEAAGISQADWLSFQDGLNAALIGSPPLQIVDTVGKVVGFVPLLATTIAGIATQVVAQTGQHIISKTLTDKFLKSNNDNFFRQRGVVVRLVRGRALRQLVGKDPKTGEPSKWAKTGQVATTVGLHLPIVRKVLSATLPAPAQHRTPLAPGSDQVDRRLATLAPEFIAPVSRDVPAARTPEGLLDKGSATAVKLRKWSAARSEANSERKLQLAAVRRGEASADSVQPAGYRGPIGLLRYGIDKAVGDKVTQSFDRRAWKAERRAARDQWRGRGVRHSDRNKQSLTDHKAAMADDKIVWLVVLTKVQDEAIHGKEEADGDEEVVVVEREEWEEDVAEAREQELEDASSGEDERGGKR